MRTIAEILTQSKTIAVVGLSSNPERSSFGVAQALQRSGYRIIPVNPKETEVLGEKSYATLEDIPVPVDIVNVFRRPEQTPQVAQSAVNIGAKALWLQLDITNEQAKSLATQAGLDYVEDHCIMVELRKLGR
jgi:predicted CoA-binding protein